MLNLASDLGTTLDIVSGVRLGPGKISVHPAKLGVIGHGFGASAAVFAAAGMPARLAAAAAIFPAVTSPPAEQPASGAATPGFDLDRARRSEDAELQRPGAFTRVADATLRIVSKAEPGGLVEGRRLTQAFGLPGPDRRTQRSVRALLTGYLLYTLGGDKTYREFADPDVDLPKTDGRTLRQNPSPWKTRSSRC